MDENWNAAATAAAATAGRNSLVIVPEPMTVSAGTVVADEAAGRLPVSKWVIMEPLCGKVRASRQPAKGAK